MPVKKSVVQKLENTISESLENHEIKTEPIVVQTKTEPVIVQKKPIIKKQKQEQEQSGGKNIQDTVTEKQDQQPKPKAKAKGKTTKVKSEDVTDDVPKPKAKAKAKSKTLKEKKLTKKQLQEGGDADIINEEIEKQIRSFKVKLPNKEDYEGRFTGLTPYQAANKALSKYFRETSEPQEEVTFCIIESTRKSKKTIYTYVGKRYKLEVPVVYKIQDGREIIKNFKNSLKKVKKADLIQ